MITLVKRGPGRPPKTAGRPRLYKGETAKMLRKLVKHHGLTGAQQVAALLYGIKISLPTLRKLAPDVELTRGKRAIA